MSKKLTTEEFIEKARLIHGNKYDYSKVIYINAKINVIIICPIHGEFEQMPDKHLNKHGCHKCGKIQAAKSKIIYTSEKMEEIKQLSKLYTSRSKFQNDYPKYYSAILRSNLLLNEFFPNASTQCKDRCLYICLFPDNAINIGLTFNIQKRQRNRILDKTDTVTKYSNKTNQTYEMIQVTKFMSEDKAKRCEDELIELFKSLSKYNVLNKRKGGSIGSKYTFTDKYIQNLVNRFDSRISFNKAYPREYQIAQRRGILNDSFGYIGISKNRGKTETFYHYNKPTEYNITQINMNKKHDLINNDVSFIVLGTKKSIKGWVINRINLKPIFSFKNRKTNEIISHVIRTEFKKLANESASCAQWLTANRTEFFKNWYLLHWAHTLLHQKYDKLPRFNFENIIH